MNQRTTSIADGFGFPVAPEVRVDDEPRPAPAARTATTQRLQIVT